MAAKGDYRKAQGYAIAVKNKMSKNTHSELQAHQQVQMVEDLAPLISNLQEVNEEEQQAGMEESKFSKVQLNVMRKRNRNDALSANIFKMKKSKKRESN